MSDSPKYCSARLSREREEALRRERERREAERRRAAEEKQRRERAARVERQQARRAGLAQRCQALQPRAARAGAARLAELVASLEATGRALSAADTDADVTRQQKALDAVETVLVQVERDVIAAIAREERSEILRSLRAQAGEVDAGLAARFDAAGARECERALDGLAAQLRQGKFDEFDRVRSAAAGAVADHAARVAESHARWVAAREQAMALAGELTHAYRTLRQDAAADDMPAAQVAALETAAASIEQQLADEAWEPLIASEATLRGELTAATAQVEDWIERRVRRETVLAALAEALPSLGFSIDPRSLSAVPAGEELTVLRAYRAGGGELAVTVGNDPAGGNEIYYEMDGFPHQEQRVTGAVVKTCDELEGLLETLHATVRGQGVEVGELDWEGKPTTRPDPFASAVAGTQHSTGAPGGAA